MEVLIETNKYQTPVTRELLDSLPAEVAEQLMEVLTTVPFVKNLISPNRPYYKDLPRDSRGAAIVDITNPPIMTNADYFRQPALFYLKHGCYTFLKPNSNPNSAYKKFWDEEMRRCYEGYIRPEDGAWISGYNYWFLNYQPMMINKKVGKTNKAIRVEEFPYFNEGNAWRYYYLYNARENAHHAIELAKRGAHPYFQKVYTPDGIKDWGDIKIGDRLYGTYGNITTVTDIPFNDIADTYRITLRDGRIVYASDDHIWNVIRANTGKILHLNTKYIYEHYISKRKKSWRIPSGKACIYFIPNHKGVEYNETEVPIDAYTLGVLIGDGCFRTWGYKNQVIFTSAIQDINTYKRIIPYSIDKIGSDEYTYAIRTNIQYLYDCNLWGCKSEDKFIPNLYKYNSRKVRLNILRGLLDTDGWIHGNTPMFDTVSKRLAEDVMEVARSLGYNCNIIKQKAGYKKDGVYRQCLDVYQVSIYGGGELFNLNRKKNKIDNTKVASRATKTCITNIEYIGKYPCKCVTVDSEDNSYLIGDFVQTHNCAKSFSLSSIMGHNLILGESKEANRRTITVLTAYQKEYLKDDKDGTLSKFKPAINFSFAHTPFPHLLLKNSPNEMTWQMGYKDEYGIERGSLNQVMAVSAKDDSEKLRGKRGWILFEEMGSFRGLLSLYDITRKSVEDGDLVFATMYLVGCVCAGTKVWTTDGRNINIEELNKEDGIVGFTDSFSTNTDPNIELIRGITKEPITNNINTANKECVRFTLSNNTVLECSIDHPVLIQKPVYNKNNKRDFSHYKEVFKMAGDLKIGDRVIEARDIPIFGNSSLFDARLVGMLIGDGSYGLRQSPKYSSENHELLDYVKNKYKWSLVNTHITRAGNIYEDIRIKEICPKLREIGIYGQVKTAKRLPNNYQTLSKNDTILLLSGLYDTDGTVYFNKDGFISLTQSNREILEQVSILWRKFGVIGTIVKTNPRINKNRKDKNPWYTFIISGRLNFKRVASTLKLLVEHKRLRLEEINNYYLQNPSKKPQKYPEDIIVHKVINIENIGIKPVYNLTAGLSHTYLANNIVTHNTAAEDESDFSSAKTLLYNTKAYNILSLPNVYDKPKQGKSTFGYFFPSYVNRAGCYNEDGVSDVVKSLVQILMARYKAKFSSDPKTVLRVIAEDPITPAEAIIKVKSAYFPVTALTERLQQLDTDPHAFDDVYVGQLVLNNKCEVEFKPTNDVPIRRYGVENDTPGAIEIFAMPEKDRDGNIPHTRYIIGHDPVDNDVAESTSLTSTFVLDLWTDTIVAEYTGRHNLANDNYEIVRLLCLFYNAKCLYESNKKGLYAYFSQMNCTHLLADTPEYLRDKQMIKYSRVGSNQKGVNASAAINNYANDLIRNWLIKPVNTIIKNDEGEEEEVTIQNLYLLRNRALIEELIAFNPEINVDRIRALGMVMLYREEKMILYQGNLNKDSDTTPKDYLGNDPFFNSYDNKKNSKFSKELSKW